MKIMVLSYFIETILFSNYVSRERPRQHSYQALKYIKSVFRSRAFKRKGSLGVTFFSVCVYVCLCTNFGKLPGMAGLPHMTTYGAQMDWK